MSALECYCDYEPASVYRSSIRRARKSYRCDDCSGTIRFGEQYEYVFAVWDSYPTSMHTCERCVDIRTWITNNVPCFCYQHGGLFETAKDAIEDAQSRAPLETAGLKFGALRRLVALKHHNAAQRKGATSS